MWTLALSLFHDYWLLTIAAIAIIAFVCLAPGAALVVLKVIRPILIFSIALPLWVFLVAGIWLYVDKTSAVRQAVNKATTQLVAGAEISALNAQLVEARRISAWSDTQAAAAARHAGEERDARADLESQLKLTAIEKKESVDDIAALKALPVPVDCAVDRAFYDGLRNK